MAVILIIDENHEEIQKLLKGTKGVNSFSFSKIDEGLDKIEGEQFDMILCELVEDFEKVKSLVHGINTKQPFTTKLYWMVFKNHEKIEDKILQLKEASILVKPLTKAELNHGIGIDTIELLAQSDINSLFDN
jgi:two-component SAPR family response regulator